MRNQTKPMTQSTLDEWQAEALARQGIKQVTNNSQGWVSDAIKALTGFCAVNSGEYRQDTIRLGIELQCGKPTHPNAWGSVFRNGCSMGLIKRTGAFCKSRIPSSHGRMVPVFKIN